MRRLTLDTSTIIQVGFLPQALPPMQDEAVILVDLIRMSTTVVECFERGALSVTLARQSDLNWREYGIPETPVVMAEVLGGRLRPGADLEPSPSLVKQYPMAGRHAVISTVNGAVAAWHLLQAGKEGAYVLGLVNLEAGVRRVVQDLGSSSRGVTILCSGYSGNRYAALEDIYLAGLITEQLQALTGGRFHEADSAKVAKRLARSYPDHLAALEDSATAGMMHAIGRSDDVVWCGTPNVREIVPRVVSEVGGVQCPVRVILA